MGQLEQLFTRKHTAGIAAKSEQEIELGARQGYPYPLWVQKLTGKRLQGPAGKLKYRYAGHGTPLRLIALRAPQERANSCNQLPGPKRLGYVIVRANFKSDNTVDFSAQSGQHDDRNHRGRSQSPANAQSVFAGQHDVQDNDVRDLPREKGVHTVGGWRNGNMKTVLAKRICQHGGDFRIVLDKKHTGRRASPRNINHDFFSRCVVLQHGNNTNGFADPSYGCRAPASTYHRGLEY
jgi:hypothetical protein